MIYDTLDHIQQYEGIHPGVMKGLRLLAETDFSTLAEGRHEIDGDNLFLLVQHYNTKVVNDTPEAHKKYIDIQFNVSGEEWIGVAPLESMTEEIEARPEGDIWFYHGPTDNIVLSGKRFMVLFPQDAHSPACVVNSPVTVKKIVGKVRI